MEYFIILLILPVAPAILFSYLARRVINWRALSLSTIAIFTLGLIGDYLGISQHIWSFTVGAGKTLGVQILSVPIEDFLLALFVPIWTVGLYELMKNWTRKSS